MVLQSGEGEIAGEHYLVSEPATVRWGFLPSRDDAPCLEVEPGSTVTIDTVSHEGILEDQGRDPLAFFGRHGVAPEAVLADAVAIAASGLTHRDEDGPHVVTGPIAVAGAAPGDVLRVDILRLVRRAPYGVVSSRHGKGCLPDAFPTSPARPGASAAAPERYGNVSTFVTIDESADPALGVLAYGDAGRRARFPLAPFLGLIGVIPDTGRAVSSVPPGRHGGNLDVKLLVEGTTLYLPVQVPGAGCYVGDPHFAQGDGEVALTALEAPLRATLRLSMLPAEEAAATLGVTDRPFAETPEHLVPIGLDEDLDEAMREATRAAIACLVARYAMAPEEAYAYCSAAVDFRVTQVVDRVKGVHGAVAKRDFA